jgi:GMP synthase (glutamine-hydrolysing)
VNRVVGTVAVRALLSRMSVRACSLTPGRIEGLRKADAIVRRLCHENGFDGQVWQFPVILIPLGTDDAPDSIVLRPVESVDGMTARSAAMPQPLLQQITGELLALKGIAGVFCDLTHKPPGTIEWE